MTNIIAKVSLFFVTLILWEHFGRIFDIAFRPTVPINILVDMFERFFSAIGSFIATLSSYLYWLKFKELGITLVELFTGLFNLVTSPLYIIKSYIETAIEFIDGPFTIYLGTFLLVVSGLFILYNYRKHIVEKCIKYMDTIIVLMLFFGASFAIKFGRQK